MPRAGCQSVRHRMNRQPPSLVERTVHRTTVHAQANGWINRSRKHQMRARRWEGKGRLEGGSRSAPGAVGPEGGSAASQKGRPAGREAKEGGREGGVEDRKEGTIEGIGEQRALYTRAKRREGANPDRVGLNPKRQRTGTDSTNVATGTRSSMPILYLPSLGRRQMRR
jgi:hypothetical protein